MHHNVLFAEEFFDIIHHCVRKSVFETVDRQRCHNTLGILSQL